MGKKIINPKQGQTVHKTAIDRKGCRQTFPQAHPHCVTKK